MKDLMKSAVMMVLILGISSGAAWGAVIKAATYDGFILHNDTYYEVHSEHAETGVWNNGGAYFDSRAIAKWNLSGITRPVDSATITYFIDWTQLTGKLAGDIAISTFTTTNNGAIVISDGGWNGVSPSTASKVAFASGTGSTGATYVSVDVTDWLNTAINAHQSYFSVRLSADYLLSMSPTDVTPGIHLSMMETGGYTTLTMIPEPATLMLLGLGVLTGMRRRRPSRQ